MVQKQTNCSVMHLKCTLLVLPEKETMVVSCTDPYLHHIVVDNGYNHTDYPQTRNLTLTLCDFDLEEGRVVREVRITRRLMDKCVVFSTTCMRGTLPCRETSGLCTLYCKCHVKGKVRNLPMSRSVYSIQIVG